MIQITLDKPLGWNQGSSALKLRLMCDCNNNFLIDGYSLSCVTIHCHDQFSIVHDCCLVKRVAKFVCFTLCTLYESNGVNLPLSILSEFL